VLITNNNNERGIGLQREIATEETNLTIQDKLTKVLRFYQSFARIVFCSGLFYYLLALSAESVLTMRDSVRIRI